MTFIGTTRRIVLTALTLAASVGVTRRAEGQATAVTRGTISDSSTNRGISGVQVRVTGSALGAVTNDAGQYTVRGVPAGTIQLTAQRLGFAPARRQVNVSAG